MTQIVMNTDGACSGNPGPGGYGAWWEYAGHRVEHFGGEANTTNNRMELLATIEGLRAIAQLPEAPSSILLRTDSQYVVNGITTWIKGWKTRNWKDAKGKDVKNQDLWQQLDAVSSKLPVTFQWVRGHNGDVGNEHADVLARRGLSEARQHGKAVALSATTPLPVPTTSSGFRP